MATANDATRRTPQLRNLAASTGVSCIAIGVYHFALGTASGAMTLYLWHMPALLGEHLMFDSLGWFRYPGQPHLILLSLLQLVVMAGLVAGLFVGLRPLENSALPGWDGAAASRPGSRSAAVDVLLCVAGRRRWPGCGGVFKDDGLYCVAVMLAALLGARKLAVPSRVSRSCGGTLDGYRPARVAEAVCRRRPYDPIRSTT